MDIGKINGNLDTNSLNNTKNKVNDDAFEKELQSAVSKKDDAEMKKVCKDFEGIILNMMYKEMKATVPKSDLIPTDPGQDIYDSMMDDQLVNESSKAGGIGLADVLYKQLSRQEKAVYKPESKGVNEVADKK
jgi:peptidoglycan hydrolase FlgJ